MRRATGMIMAFVDRETNTRKSKNRLIGARA
jgi:hypothetical protein